MSTNPKLPNDYAKKYLKQPKDRESMTEDQVQLAYIKWFMREYPQHRIITTLNGIVLPKVLAIKASRLQSHRGVPDNNIPYNNGKFCGLYLELKKSDVKIYKKDGTFVSNEHFREQAEYLQYLRTQGYCADFAIGYVDAVIKTKTYMDGESFEYLLK
jgi:hypothetical protein